MRPARPLPDGKVAEAAREALETSPLFAEGEVRVSVQDGTARLSGDVDSSFELLEAEDIVARVPGVTGVVNRLDVPSRWRVHRSPHHTWYGYPRVYDRAPGRVTDRELQEAIEGQLFWSPFVDSDAVEVRVEDGVAILTGAVDNHMERGAAEDNAYQGGAELVRNRIVVREGTGS